MRSFTRPCEDRESTNEDEPKTLQEHINLHDWNDEIGTDDDDDDDENDHDNNKWVKTTTTTTTTTTERRRMGEE